MQKSRVFTRICQLEALATFAFRTKKKNATVLSDRPLPSVAPFPRYNAFGKHDPVSDLEDVGKKKRALAAAR